jgi:cyclophilin family peptidyl-prolyl cis-trans isomerase
MRHHLAIIAALFTFVFALSTINAQEKPKGTEKQMTETKNDQKEIVVIETTMGTIEVAMFRAEAPKTVENFIKLAQKGYYNGIIFHRIIENFMIQGGDPTGTGTGGESIYGAKFEDEISPKLKFDRPGLLAMANAGPNTNGSQFFITLVPTDWLNGKHTIFGEVVAGKDVVNAIGKVETKKPNNKPVKDVVMTKVYLKGAKQPEAAPKK